MKNENSTKQPIKLFLCGTPLCDCSHVFVFYAAYELDLVINFVASAACLGLRSCHFNEATWQMLYKACMDKPCLCQALHIIVNPITAAPQASQMENIPKYDNTYKKYPQKHSNSIFKQSKCSY